jgi:malonyl-CoA O-methyltransferase
MPSLDKKKIVNAFSRSASSYDQFSHLQKSIAMELAAHTSMLGIAPKNILDIGTGTGDLPFYLADTFPDAKISGIDIAQGMIDAAKEKNKSSNISFVIGDAEKLPYKNGSFDLVISSSTYQWVNDLSLAFDEAFRVLAAGGTFIFATYGPSTLKELKQAYMLKADSNATYLHEYKDVMQISGALFASGFAVNNISTREIKQLYSDCREMFRVLKGIGAMNAAENQPKGLKGHDKMTALMNYYESTFTQENGIYATYEIIQAICKKV